MPCESGLTQVQELKYETDKVTQLLCATLTELRLLEMEYKGMAYPQAQTLERVPGLRKWWDQHVKKDKARIAREAAAAEHERLKQSALSKLTVEEAKALGVRI